MNPLWIIAVVLVLGFVWKVAVASFEVYIHRTKYNNRSKFKKMLNWIVNGSFE